MWNLVVRSTITMTKPPAAYDKFPPGHLNSPLDTWFKPYHDDKCFNKTRNMPWDHLINHTDPGYLHRFLCISLITPRHFNEGQSDCLLALANCEQWVCPGYDKHILSCMGDTYYSSPPSAAYMRKWNGSALVQIRLVAFSAPSNYQNQCWVIVNWTRRDKLQWKFSQIINFFQENASENTVREMADILFRRRWANENNVFCTAGPSPLPFVAAKTVVKAPRSQLECGTCQSSGLYGD